MKVSEEQSNAVHQESLAKQYDSQVQELRNKLTDSRFERARSQLDDSTDRFSSI